MWKHDLWEYEARPRVVRASLFGLLIMSGAVVLGLALYGLGVDHANIVMVLLLGVLFTSVVGGRWLGSVASLFGVVAFNFFFTEPRFTLAVNNPQYLITFPVMLVVALVTSELTTRVRRQAFTATVRERRTEILYRVSRALLGAGSVAEAAQTVVEHLEGMLRTAVAFGVPDTTEQTIEWQAASNRARANWPDDACASVALAAVRLGVTCGVGTEQKASAPALATPVNIGADSLGVVIVDCATEPLSSRRITLLEAVTAQLALAIDRERLAAAQEASRISLERERLRNKLLRSISHDLRSPLATIAGSASTVLLNHRGELNAETADLIGAVVDDATWLSDVVENLLSLTRVEAGEIALHCEPEVAEELVEAVLHRLRYRFGDRRLRVAVPNDPVLVAVDAHLIQQVLTNVVDNALRYAGGNASITLTVVSVDAARVGIIVDDDGPGFGPEALQHLFERRMIDRAVLGDARRGLGLGLAICKAIVEAHGGTIHASNRADGGARVEIELPRAGVHNDIETWKQLRSS